VTRIGTTITEHRNNTDNMLELWYQIMAGSNKNMKTCNFKLIHELANYKNNTERILGEKKLNEICRPLIVRKAIC